MHTRKRAHTLRLHTHHEKHKHSISTQTQKHALSLFVCLLSLSLSRFPPPSLPPVRTSFPPTHPPLPPHPHPLLTRAHTRPPALASKQAQTHAHTHRISLSLSLSRYSYACPHLPSRKPLSHIIDPSLILPTVQAKSEALAPKRADRRQRGMALQQQCQCRLRLIFPRPSSHSLPECAGRAVQTCSDLACMGERAWVSPLLTLPARPQPP